MPVVAEERPRQKVLNVPNQLTAARLVLSIVLFVLIPLHYYLASMVLFIVAASTDWIDGYWARKYGQVTTVGRIFDPFADKIIICGSFIFLAAIPDSAIVAWMAVVVVAREMLVTALRNFLEGEGADFSAKMSGKLKMAFQCAAVVLSLYALTFTSAVERPTWLQQSLVASVWGTLALTIYSGIEYIRRAMLVMREHVS